MEQIDYDFSRSKGRNAEHVQLMTNLKTISSDEQATKYNFLPQWKYFTTCADTEIDNFNPAIRFLATIDVVSLDTWRDKIFFFYKNWAKAFADYAPDEERQRAGNALYLLFKDAGNVTSRAYMAATAVYNDIIDSLGDEPYASALTLLHMEEAPEKLKEANDAFNDVYNDRSHEDLSRKKITDLKTLRPITDKAFDTLAKAVNALYMVNELTTQDETTRTDLGKVIQLANSFLLRFRKTVGANTSGKSEEEEEGGDTPTPEPTVHEITEVYQKEGGNPEKPLEIERSATTVIRGTGLTLLNATGDGLGDIIIKPTYPGVDTKVEPTDITKHADTLIEFNMIPDLIEGQYMLRIETYYNGEGNPPLKEPIVISFPKEITLV